MVLKSGTNDATCFCRLGFESVPPRMPIRIVNVNEPSSLTFAKTNKLGPTQAVRSGQARGTSFQAKDRVRRAADGSHACSGLIQIGVRWPINQDSSMQLGELPAKTLKGGKRTTTLLHARNVGRPVGKSRKVRGKGGDIFGLE